MSVTKNTPLWFPSDELIAFLSGIGGLALILEVGLQYSSALQYASNVTLLLASMGVLVAYMIASLWIMEPPMTDLKTQVGHGIWGALITMSFSLAHHTWWGVGAAFAWATLKEFVFDKLIERQGFADNLHDFLSYAYGTGFALVLLAIHHFVK